MYFVHPAIQQYDWGDYRFIPEFLNINATNEPFAELWYGTHERGMSKLPELHTTLREHLGEPLPYLLKILAIRSPLSLQVHPNKAQAESGFAQEEEKGIPQSAPNRNYRDTNHKLEILVALTEVWALSSLRSLDEIEQNLEAFSLELPEKSSTGLRDCIARLLRMKNNSALAEKVLRHARAQIKKNFDVHWWAIQLASLYPGDMGIIMPYLLNLVQLKPGEALFNNAGELHAYLQGSGVELMTNSDNVLRGACTSKHRDIEELCKISSFTPRRPHIVQAQTLEEGNAIYSVPTDEFLLYRIRASKPVSCPLPSGRGILLCTEGKAHVRDKNRHCEIAKADAVFCSSTYVKIEGKGEIFVATHAANLG